MTQNAYSKSVGEWILAQRTALELSQEDVAHAIDVSQASLCKWERGEGILSSYSHAKLRGFFKAQKSLHEANHAPEAQAR